MRCINGCVYIYIGYSFTSVRRKYSYNSLHFIARHFVPCSASIKTDNLDHVLHSTKNNIKDQLKLTEKNKTVVYFITKCCYI